MATFKNLVEVPMRLKGTDLGSSVRQLFGGVESFRHNLRKGKPVPFGLQIPHKA